MIFFYFINLNIVLWGDNSYYPIKFDIFPLFLIIPLYLIRTRKTS